MFHTHIRASTSPSSQVILGWFKNGKPFSSTNTPEVVKWDVPNSDASQPLVLGIRTLVASCVRVLIGHPQASIRARIWQTESIGTKFVRRIGDAAQEMGCWLRFQVWVGKQAADFRIRQQACSLGLRPCFSWAISPNWRNTRYLAFWCQFPGYTKSSNAKDDLVGCNEGVQWTQFIVSHQETCNGIWMFITFITEADTSLILFTFCVTRCFSQRSLMQNYIYF